MILLRHGEKMNTDTNLLLGVLALQADLIDSRQFIEACVLWTGNKEQQLIDLLIERGWIEQDDKIHLEYFLKRRLEKQDASECLAAVLPGHLCRSLAGLEDDEINQSLSNSANLTTHDVGKTLTYLPSTEERYQVQELLATGGIGRVWLAHDRALDRNVALKDLLPEYCNNVAARERFIREARFTGQLEHPGIVPVYEVAQRERDRQSRRSGGWR